MRSSEKKYHHTKPQRWTFHSTENILTNLRHSVSLTESAPEIYLTISRFLHPDSMENFVKTQSLSISSGSAVTLLLEWNSTRRNLYNTNPSLVQNRCRFLRPRAISPNNLVKSVSRIPPLWYTWYALCSPSLPPNHRLSYNSVMTVFTVDTPIPSHCIASHLISSRLMQHLIHSVVERSTMVERYRAMHVREDTSSSYINAARYYYACIPDTRAKIARNHRQRSSHREKIQTYA